MEKSEDSLERMDTNNQEAGQPLLPNASSDAPNEPANVDSSQSLFPESPVYEPDEEMVIISSTTDDSKIVISSDSKDEELPIYTKRKHLDDISDSSAKIQKLESIEEDFSVSSQALDNEVSEITSASNRKIKDLELPSTSRVRTPVRSSPRKIKRSNSADIANPKTPKTPKSRPASVDVTKVRKTPGVKTEFNPKSDDVHVISSDSCSSRPSVEFVREIPPPDVPETIAEENSELQDSQDVHLTFSDDDSDNKPKEKSHSDPVVVKDREEVTEPIKIRQTHSAGYNYSDQSNNLSQPMPKDYNLGKTTDQESTDSISSINLESPDHIPSLASKVAVVKDREDITVPSEIHLTGAGYDYPDKNLSQSSTKDYNLGKTTDLETTDSVCSINLESPDHIPTVASKLISKLSNGDSSTPTDGSGEKHDTDATPDMTKLSSSKGKRLKNESFRASNNTTPSTISPLQNGHSLPISTPQIPSFDVHISHSEENEFLSLYVVRTDNDLGMDMCREYQRISKRFTIDPYLADVSVSNSPSSVTSGGLVNLPNRTSFASTTTSTSTSSNRTSDGNFVVPQPPRKSVINPTSSVKGYEALMKKLQDIFSHIRESSVDTNRSLSDDNKVSVGVQTSVSTDSNMSNGNASPEEVGKCDKATPKSSLKKTRVRGRRHIASKTKRALLPTQAEEPEQGMNSPEMVPNNSENGKDSPVKSPKDEKPLSSLVATPKSISKLKQKRRPTSPRPATPVEKAVVKQEYPGFPPGTAVLAKWVDRRYYSGRVLEITEPNKYLIKFDDGQSKVLLDDFIIFGDMKTLPLDGQSVYAIVDEEQNYEPGLVLGLEENDSGTVTYRCTTDGDTIVMVTASELYLTEDQARSLKESVRPRSPSAPTTPRRRHNRELDLDNIIQGPRSARSRDKGNSSARKRVASPKSPKASTSGVKSKGAVGVGAGAGGGAGGGAGAGAGGGAVTRRRPASESSEMSESSNSAPACACARLEEVAGVEPEVQRTPRKIDGVKAGPLQLKGAAKQNLGKKNSKLNKFENDEDTVSKLGPIPCGEKKIFAGLHFLLTCTETPKRFGNEKNNSAQNPKITALKKDFESQDARQDSSDDTEASVQGTDTEDLEFSNRPFNKERLKEQLEAGGGVVHSHFDDVPKSKYSVCKLIAARPCVTAKYIECLAADIRAVSHAWVIDSCARRALQDLHAYTLPAGWSFTTKCHVNWLQNGKRNATFFKDKIILLCGDQDTFVKFWERVCTLAGATTRVVNEEDLNMTGAYALVTEWDCPHEVQNKANQDNIPLVATEWVVQCLIEAKVLPPTSHDRFSFMYTEPE